MSELTAEQVKAYLHQHPDFFEQHPELLKVMTLSHQVPGASSLLQKKNSLIQTQLNTQKLYFDQLVNYARKNELLFGYIREVTLRICEATNKEEVLKFARQYITTCFAIDGVSFVTYDIPCPPPAIQTGREMAQSWLPKILVEGQSLIGHLQEHTIRQLFPDNDTISSFAIAPIHDNQGHIFGALILGHNDPNHFHPKADTLFVDFLGSLIGAMIMKFN